MKLPEKKSAYALSTLGPLKSKDDNCVPGTSVHNLFKEWPYIVSYFHRITATCRTRVYLNIIGNTLYISGLKCSRLLYELIVFYSICVSSLPN